MQQGASGLAWRSKQGVKPQNPAACALLRLFAFRGSSNDVHQQIKLSSTPKPSGFFVLPAQRRMLPSTRRACVPSHKIALTPHKMGCSYWLSSRQKAELIPHRPEMPHTLPSPPYRW